ncbi:Urease accessory protein UreF [Prochlorococcus marinus str. MIT 9321]|uniref:Urease accessory protein UreF n=1 Tax=Prochlorococcus marinus str. MIT 9401 TaxID=167551 RepID=A0A0A2B3D5_PROMR|nr:urease accessory UreF family protein [Prochlorococcus marinus]KGG04438.1 Urease accessory protein UreF [Prochlorococcus marinus str. MIT 9322]KGG05107.1 Urease accessory protein UreF [Prochlorococcus marinus str. MIT 9321]KGG07119.1 Urease accessory protein UreF [Prochlorococcus marinus str. MIT 9401]
MSKSHLLKYLLISPNLPIGGFCYSEGMESYLHNKNLTDSNSVKDLIISELKIGQIRLDGRLLLDFFDIFKEIENDKNLKSNLQKLLSLDKWILASKDSVEMRAQQVQMANSLFELTKEFGFEYLFEKNKKSSWPLAWSWACYCFEISKLEMVENFFYSWSANQLSAALRIIPIGSTKAQIIQKDLLATISIISKEIMDKEIFDIYFGNVGLAMAQQNHNELYTKLFRN